MTPYFGQIHVQGFRRLHDINLPLRRLNVIIGANGCGKSSMLDAFSLLSASASGGLNAKIGEFGGMASITTRDRGNRMSFQLTLEESQTPPMIYELVLAATGIGYNIERETLAERSSTQASPQRYVDVRGQNLSLAELLRLPSGPPETVLSQQRRNPFPKQELAIFASQLASFTYYHALNVEPRSAVRLPQPLRPAVLPGRDGEDLVSCLFSLRETYRDRFEAVEDMLRVAFPRFERLDFPPVAAGTLAMSWRDAAFSQPMYMHQLSEGTLRFLWLTALLQSPGLSAVTLIDEPEVSLHPELLGHLADLMREASQRTQLVVATHSDRLIGFLDPSEVIVMDVEEDGTAKATWADQPDIQEWLKDYTLEEVWRLGRMGGRP